MNVKNTAEQSFDLNDLYQQPNLGRNASIQSKDEDNGDDFEQYEKSFGGDSDPFEASSRDPLLDRETFKGEKKLIQH